MTTDAKADPMEAAFIGPLERANNLHRALARSHPALARGQVWCMACGRTQRVDSAECFRRGWPRCCGATMTIDAPSERKALQP